jgi:hypothetical protein
VALEPLDVLIAKEHHVDHFVVHDDRCYYKFFCMNQFRFYK